MTTGIVQFSVILLLDIIVESNHSIEKKIQYLRSKKTRLIKPSAIWKFWININTNFSDWFWINLISSSFSWDIINFGLIKNVLLEVRMHYKNTPLCSFSDLEKKIQYLSSQSIKNSPNREAVGNWKFAGQTITFLIGGIFAI